MTKADVIDAKTRSPPASSSPASTTCTSTSSPSGTRTTRGCSPLGDRRVADVIEHAEANGGNWRAAVAESRIDADAYLYRDTAADAFLPWQIIDGGLKTDFLRDELAKSAPAEWTLPAKRRTVNTVDFALREQ